MSSNPFIEELRWRGMLHELTPGLEEQLNKESTIGYVGFDPTSDSLGIGNLVPILLLKHFQRFGHKPIALVGGATGMIGDPSGKSAERNLLSEEQIRHNVACQQKQLEKFLQFGSGPTDAEIVNNYDWFKEMGFLQFLRDVGKHITISYMMAKDSVQNRLETGISFTEFSYQLLQGYDYYILYHNKNVRLQMGGSDQWGNMTTGIELIRRKNGGNAYALTCPLITKTDGTKFGKTESGNLFLDPKKTSPYKFYQYWLNTADEDALRYIKIFTFLPKQEIDNCIAEHIAAPHTRAVQKLLAKEITTLVHSDADYQFAVKASEVLFGKSTADALKQFSNEEFQQIFEGVPSAIVPRHLFDAGIDAIDLFTEKSGFLPSKSEARRAIQGKGLSINKQVVNAVEQKIDATYLINEKYILLQKGKKDYFLVIAEN
jgi:tyrosyl-tRNA synthetase